MDDLDKRILNELQMHGWQISETLSAHLGIGSRTIRRRLGIMKDKGIFKIIPVPNYVLLGYQAWANLGIKVSPFASNMIAKKLLEHAAVHFVASSFGKFDFIVGVIFETIEELNNFVNSELIEIPGIENIETIMLVSPRKYYDFSWPPAAVKRGKGRIKSPLTSKYRIDATDREIVNLLKQNGLIPTSILSLKLSITEGTVRKHIKKMRIHNIFNFEIAPNPSILEDEVWATLGINTNRPAQDIIDEIIKIPAVYLASTSIGRFNLIISAKFPNLELFSQFVNVGLARVAGINQIESFLHTKPLKYHSINWSLLNIG
jgi:Lrp/AsnC family transcriptional regulator, regulator for asnA, asnC and gidA